MVTDQLIQFSFGRPLQRPKAERAANAIYKTPFASVLLQGRAFRL